MNILPKKRWHVRTRENIARVRRDEAEAAENEKIQKARSQKAETEARINLLRQKTRARNHGQDEDIQNEEVAVEERKLEHVNFFADLESGIVDHHKPNDEHEAEKKAEKEKYEQQIGYLTYLGKNINDSKDNSRWYNEMPRRLIDKETKKGIQEDKKMLADPMVDIKRYIGIMKSSGSHDKTEISENTSKKRRYDDSDEDIRIKNGKKKKTKKRKDRTGRSQSSKDSSSHLKIEKLRNERLAREKAEKMRTEALLAKLRGKSSPVKETVQPQTIRQKYNSQYFPEIARQNATISRKQR